MNLRPYILVAEDDADSTFLLRYAFSQVAPGLQVAYTCDGKQAVDFLQGKNVPEEAQLSLPGLFLLDLKMPQMDGFEVLEFLQRAPSLRPKCIVVFTASPAQHDIARARDLGADYYIVKPVALNDLLDIIRVVAGCAQAGAAQLAQELPSRMVPLGRA